MNRKLNRDAIKCIAMLTMLLNHIAILFLNEQTMLYQIFVDTGYFTAITMCYFLVEGYQYTHDKGKYAIRLLVFAVLSQVPYELAFHQRNQWGFPVLNMMFTLLLCFYMIYLMETIRNPQLQLFPVALLMLASIVCDWPILAPLFTFLFESARQKKMEECWAFFIAIIACIVTMGATQSLGPVAAVLLLTWFYNGKRIQKWKTVFKWFFYLFYPMHLLILVIIKQYYS